jgi:acetyl esterase
MPRADLAALFEMLRSAPRVDSIIELRAQLELFAPFINANPPPVGSVDAGARISGDVTADVIVPPGAPPFPVLLYLHGGGWSIGSPNSHAKLARQFSVGAGAVVVTVDYRLAPEHPFPVPLEDCVTAARWTRANVQRYGGDPQRLAVGGDSAGANLSAAVINALHDEISFRAALLIYGAFDMAASWRDYDRYAPEEDPVLPKYLMRMMMDAYLSGGASSDDPRVSPLFADLRHFPPSCFIVGAVDPLFGESVTMRDTLQALGCECEFHRYAEMPHAFLHFDLPEAAQGIDAASRFLRRHLGA